MGNRPAQDERRDEALKALGIETIRIPASDVLRSPGQVAEAIIRYCKRQ